MRGQPQGYHRSVDRGTCRQGIELRKQPCCTRDEGGPVEVGLQGQASNHLKLLWSKAVVVSVKEKGAARPRQVRTVNHHLKITPRYHLKFPAALHRASAASSSTAIDY
jgi:hypothetical protein